jgi:hypothetical protein
VAETAVDRVRALHQEDYGICAHCTRAEAVPFPCATIQALDEPDDPDAGHMPIVADVSTRTYTCPECGSDDAVMEAAFTVTTRLAVHQIGTFAFCFACERAQEAARA